MGADSPDDSLLFAGRLPGARPGAPVGGRQCVPASGASAGRMRSSRSFCGGIPACSSWTATTPRNDGCGAGPPAQERRLHRDRARHHPRRRPTTRSRSRPGSRAGADEVITGLFSPAEQRSRLDAMLVRTERDVSVHPSTRLPGTTEIEREIRRRLESGQEFAVCYADLDHFKEFNDRYSYYDGDRVIYLLSRILHDVVKGLLGPRGFVGHIGGDDFIFVIPAAEISAVCSEILDVFDYADAAAVQRAGSPGRVLLRQGSPGPAAPGAADDAVDRHRDQPASQVCASGPGERACDRNEELRQDAARVGVRGRSAAGRQRRRAAGPSLRDQA